MAAPLGETFWLPRKRISTNVNQAVLVGAAVCQHLGVDLQPHQFIVIGDTPNDIACARHFGARALAVGTGRLYQTADLLACNPDAFIPNFSDLELVMHSLAEL